MSEDPRSLGPGKIMSVDDEKRAESISAMRDTLDKGGMREKIVVIKRILAQTASGTDHSGFFPDIVKNVLTNNFELKKLVYIYLTYYAGKNQELALLSINAFQRDMTNENQLIRALALRVMSSIRVGMVTQLVVLAIRKAVQDRSAYVRKTAAMAACKVADVESSEHHESLVEVVTQLLEDKAAMVMGAALVAFNRVCPDRFDLIHPHYRRLCVLTRDLDEWGQVAALEMFTRYVRTQFIDPQKPITKDKKPEKDDSDSEEEEEEEDAQILDPDHRLLLRMIAPLLQSRNSAVVAAVAMLYAHTAPTAELPLIARSLVRILRSAPEIKFVALQCIISLAQKKPSIFIQFLKEFFISGSDPAYCRGLKLQILTQLANQSNINVILREFQTYVKHHDPTFVAQTIRAIGQCAIRVPEVTDNCLQGLLVLMGSRVPQVVSESVVVVKKLLQVNPTGHDDAISKLCNVLDDITVPLARASIVWVIGEYFQRMPKKAPDVLRRLAKSFTTEDDLVKLQTINLAVKLYSKKCEPFDKISMLFQYVIQLAKYDLNYDIRDRARMMSGLLLPKSDEGDDLDVLSESVSSHPLTVVASDILFATKPVPSLADDAYDRSRYVLGTLSYVVNHPVSGYQGLAEWPEEQPDPSVRQSDIAVEEATTPDSGKRRTVPSYSDESFYSTSSSDYSGSSYTGSSYSESESGSSFYSDSESEPEEPEKKPVKPPTRGRQREVSDLLDLADFDPSSLGGSSDHPSSGLANDLAGLHLGETATGGVLSPTSATATAPLRTTAPRVAEPAKLLLLNSITGNGLEAQYSFSRRSSLFGDTMTHIKVHLVNRGTDAIPGIRVEGIDEDCVPFQTIPLLQSSEQMDVDLNIDFKLKANTIKFKMVTDNNSFTVKLTPPIGELVVPESFTSASFDLQQGKLGGMNAKSRPLSVPQSSKLVTDTAKTLSLAVSQACNLGYVDSKDDGTTVRFGGQTLTLASQPVLLAVTVSADEDSHNVDVTVWCENTMLASRLCEAVRKTVAEMV